MNDQFIKRAARKLTLVIEEVLVTNRKNLPSLFYESLEKTLLDALQHSATEAEEKGLKEGTLRGLALAMGEASCGEKHQGAFHTSTCKGTLVDRAEVVAAIQKLIDDCKG